MSAQNNKLEFHLMFSLLISSHPKLIAPPKKKHGNQLHPHLHEGQGSGIASALIGVCSSTSLQPPLGNTGMMCPDECETQELTGDIELV
jgi:hypothetical protein